MKFLALALAVFFYAAPTQALVFAPDSSSPDRWSVNGETVQVEHHQSKSSGAQIDNATLSNLRILGPSFGARFGRNAIHCATPKASELARGNLQGRCIFANNDHLVSIGINGFRPPSSTQPTVFDQIDLSSQGKILYHLSRSARQPVAMIVLKTFQSATETLALLRSQWLSQGWREAPLPATASPVHSSEMTLLLTRTSEVLVAHADNDRLTIIEQKTSSPPRHHPGKHRKHSRHGGFFK